MIPHNNNNHNNIWQSIHRGGATMKIHDDNDDDDAGWLIQSIRSIIHSIVGSNNDNSDDHGIIQSIIISSIQQIESIFNISLLPKSSSSKSQMKKKLSSSLSKNKPSKSSLSSSTATRKKKKKIKQDIINKSERIAEEDEEEDDKDEIIIKRKEQQDDIDENENENENNQSTLSTPFDKVQKKKKTMKMKKKKQSINNIKHTQIQYKSNNPNYRIQKELKTFMNDPPDNISVTVVGNNIRIWIVTIIGAKNTVYENEIFHLRIQFPNNYPTVPPSVYFLPKPSIPIHEHVYTNGDICLSLLGKDWRPTMTGQSIAVSILSILSSAQYKSLPMDNARHAQNQPGQYQKDWVYHDDNC